MKIRYFTVVLLLLFPSSFYSAPWEPDLSFNQTGKISLVVGESGNARDVLVQDDGKIIVVGVFQRTPTDPFITLVRYNSNGTIDPSFGNNGIVETNLGKTSENVNSAQLQPDGKIVIGGSVSFGNVFYFVVARYNSDGQLDQTFNGTGIKTFNQEDRNVVQKVVLQPDGKILVAGFILRNTDVEFRFALARLNSNGAIDTTFGNAGFVVSQVGFSQSIADDAIVLADGKILAVGRASISADGIQHFAVVRYESNGSLDNTFGDNGVLIIPIQGSPSNAFKVLEDEQGRYIVGGSKFVAGRSDPAIIRLNANATIDTSFGNNGVFNYSTFETDGVSDISLLPNGKLVVGIYNISGENPGDFKIIRVNPNGELDSSFNQSQLLSINFNGHDSLRKLSVLDSGKIIAVGSQNDFNGFAIAQVTTKAVISGRVLANDNVFVSNALIRVLSSDGNVFNLRANQFGNFNLSGIYLGTTLTFDVFSKSYNFDNQNLFVNEEIENPVITAQP